jgi:hypothetical protein
MILSSQIKACPRNNEVGKENKADDYRLFANIINTKNSSPPMPTSKIQKNPQTNRAVFQNSPTKEYFSVIRSDPVKKKTQKPPKQQIEQYFNDTPSLIRSKSNTSKTKIPPPAFPQLEAKPTSIANCRSRPSH